MIRAPDSGPHGFILSSFKGTLLFRGTQRFPFLYTPPVHEMLKKVVPVSLTYPSLPTHECPPPRGMAWHAVCQSQAILLFSYLGLKCKLSNCAMMFSKQGKFNLKCFLMKYWQLRLPCVRDLQNVASTLDKHECAHLIQPNSSLALLIVCVRVGTLDCCCFYMAAGMLMFPHPLLGLGSATFRENISNWVSMTT